MDKNLKYISTVGAELKKISFSDRSIDLPNLKDTTESKSIIIGKWIIKWLDKDLKTGKIQENNVLPSKSEFAYALGVSLGTVQNAIRYIEDLGYVESKQRIGTLVKSVANRNTTTIKKLTSKKDLTIAAIINQITKTNLKIGDTLPASVALSKTTGYTINTVRLALETLAGMGIIEKANITGKVNVWKLKSKNYTIKDLSQIDKKTTLVQTVSEEIEKYILDNLKTGDKLPAHEELAKMFKVSIKTIHDSLQVLAKNDIVLPKRGAYGTTVLRHPSMKDSDENLETSIFAPAKDAAFYHYEKTQNKIKKLIADNYQIGDKLPSVKELSRKFDLNPNTIRKAYQNLSKDGYLVFSRGRYGGTFVIDIPETDEQTFKWLAVNPQYAKNYISQTNNN